MAKGSKNRRAKGRRGESERPNRSEETSEVEPSPRRRRKVDSRPDSPWGGFPVAEILVLAGIGFLVWGFAASVTPALVAGLVLASLGGLELSIREHFGGYRSHTLLLASALTLAVLAGCYYLIGLPPTVCLVIAAVVFAAAFYGLRRAFQKASGGFSFRIGGFRG